MAHRYDKQSEPDKGAQPLTSPPKKSRAKRATAKTGTPKGSKAGKPTTLLPDQMDALIGWIAEGLTQGQIFNRAINFDPPFEPSPFQISYYRKSREIDIVALRKSNEAVAITQGLALRSERLKALLRLAGRLEDELYLKNKLWLDRTKSLAVGKGQYEKIEEIEFNAALVKELRAAYGDIAAEVGGRIMRHDLTSKDKPIKGYVGVSPDDWDRDVSKEQD